MLEHRPLNLESPLDEQAALRRVATLVARGTSEERLFAAVTEQIGRLFEVDQTWLNRYEPDGGVTVVGTWACRGDPIPVGTRWTPDDTGYEGQTDAISLARRVFETGAPARIDDWEATPGRIASVVHGLGDPLVGREPDRRRRRLWGYVTVSTSRAPRLPEGIEAHLEGFTELVATAIANSEARGELTRLADEQAALQRVATLVAREVPASEVFAAVIEEVVRLLGADIAGMSRYEPGDVQQVVAAWPPDRAHLGIGTRLPVNGRGRPGRPRAGRRCGRPAWTTGASSAARSPRRSAASACAPRSRARSWSPETCGA